MTNTRSESSAQLRPFPLRDYRRVLILARREEDVVYGCGGLIAHARECGIETTALILTDSTRADRDPAFDPVWRSETRPPAALLGYRLELDLVKGSALVPDGVLTLAISAACDRIQPDLVIAPCLDTPETGHQALALGAIQILGGAPHSADLAFYETQGGLTHVTHTLDVSSCYPAKRAAMQCFVEREDPSSFHLRIEARDTFRGFALDPEAAFGEAFFLAPLRAHGFSALIPALDPLFRHGHLATVAHPAEAPLVSVLIRSIGDPLLEQAVASVLAQSYRPLEIVIVAAQGNDLLAELPHLSACPLIRQHIPASPLDRPAAANTALDAAAGRYLIFLDDDDLLLPDHLGKLVSALRAHPEALAAHAPVVVQSTSGETLRHYAYAVEPERMLGANLLPIHAVLFDRRLIDDLGCRFDETLPRLEDWDFWLQVSQHTGFVATEGISAIYRYRDRSGFFGPDTAASNTSALRLGLLGKWRDRLGDARFDAALVWYARSLDEIEQRLAASTEQASACAAEQKAELLLLLADTQAQEERMAQVLASTSWRITSPLRWLMRLIRRHSR